MEPDTGEDAITKKAAGLLRTRHTMTLATARNNNPWAAPVYYISIKAGLYFFSNPESRHIMDVLASGRAACAIYDENTAWENLRGLQMSGAVYPVPPGIEAAAAVSVYVKKFPFIRSFFADAKGLDLAGFQRLFRADLYCFKPELICYMDNSVRFGFRKEIQTKVLFQ